MPQSKRNNASVGQKYIFLKKNQEQVKGPPTENRM